MNIKNNKGFSLLEVMVVVGIIGILTSVAVPAYNNYRDTAGRSTLNASLANVEKAYLACMAVGSGTCDTLPAIGLSDCQGCTLADASGFGSDTSDPDFCLHKEQQIGSNLYKACVSIEEQGGFSNKTMGIYKKASDGTVTLTSGKSFCYCAPADDASTLNIDESSEENSTLEGSGNPCDSTSDCGCAVNSYCKSGEGICSSGGKCI